jgi:hypothetical protein
LAIIIQFNFQKHLYIASNIHVMKPFLQIILMVLVSAPLLKAGEEPLLNKINIGESGCTAYMIGKPGEVSVSKSPDGSDIFTVESISQKWPDHQFGLILVRLVGMDEGVVKEQLLMAYMDYLKGQFSITASAGYGKGHTLETHPTAKGVIDYWEGSDGLKWVLKGWTAEDFLVVMFISGPETFDNINVQQVFFNGIRFPGDN